MLYNEGLILRGRDTATGGRTAVEELIRKSSLMPILGSLDQAVTIVDRAGRVLEWNAAAEQIYGIRRDQIVGKLITHFFAPGSVMVRRVLQTGETIESKYHQPRPGIHVLVTAAPVMDGNQLIGAVAVEQNVTQMVELSAELLRVRDQVAELKRQLSVQSPKSPSQTESDPFQTVKGRHPAIQQAVDLARRVAPTEATVMIRGESGVGKELFAHAIHLGSNRRTGPFVALNCSAIPAPLFESELFGYAPGAFTGANPKGQPGKVELAQGGTLFLDEVGDLALESQAKLLRFLEERRFYRVGGATPVPVDIRIIVATNRNLEQMVQEGRYRDDLYWRLNVVSLELPPLRERRQDIAEMVRLYIHEFNLRHNRSVARMHPGVIEALMNHSWPGNVRELRNAVERMVVLAEDGVVGPDLLPAILRPPLMTGKLKPDGATAAQPDLPVRGGGRRRPAGREEILKALESTGYNRSEAARLLGISRGTLYNRSRQHGIELCEQPLHEDEKNPGNRNGSQGSVLGS